MSSKCFFHLDGLTKNIGSSSAAQTPFIAPKVWPKLNILVTPWPGIAFTCSTTTAVSSLLPIFSFIIFTNVNLEI